MKKTLAIAILAMILFVGASSHTNAQCAMCKASTTSNMNNKDRNAGNTKIGSGLNIGILYLMGVPYLLGGLGAFFYWRNRRQIKAFLNGEPV